MPDLEESKGSTAEQRAEWMTVVRSAEEELSALEPIEYNPTEDYLAILVEVVPALLEDVRVRDERIAAVLALRHGPFGPWDDDLVSWTDVERILSDDDPDGE